MVPIFKKWHEVERRIRVTNGSHSESIILTQCPVEVSLEGARVAPAAKDGGAPCGVRLKGARVVWFQPLTTGVYAECDLYNTRSQAALELQKL